MPRWWDVSPAELHAAALYQRAGEELLTARGENAELRGKVMGIGSRSDVPGAMESALEECCAAETKEYAWRDVMPAETFFLTAEFRKDISGGDQRRPAAAGRELDDLARQDLRRR